MIPAARVGDSFLCAHCEQLVIDLPDGARLDAATGERHECSSILREGAHQTESKAVPPFAPPPPLGMILDSLVTFVRKFVVLTEEQAAALALWIAHTHAFEAADSTPYINVRSAEKRSGKTRLLEALALLVARPWSTGRVTTSVLMRRIERDHPTLLLDESDAAFKGEHEYAEALRGMLDVGHRRGGMVSVSVARGRDFDARDFEVYCPKAIAGIGRLPDTVADRSIEIELRRRRADERVVRFRVRDVEVEADPIRVALARWAADEAVVAELREARPELPDELDDRAQDGWEPLLAIADLAGGDWPERAQRAAVALAAGHDADDADSLGVRLLRDVRVVFDERKIASIATADLVRALIAMEEAPWGDLRGNEINPRALARLLKRYGVRSKTIRVGDKTPRGYERSAFEDPWARYVPGPLTPGTQHPQHPTRDGGVEGIHEVQREVPVADAQKPKDQVLAGDVAVVADKRPGSGAEPRRSRVAKEVP